MHERDTERLREVAAEFLSREATRQSLITVTRASLTDDRKHGTVFITVFPDSMERAAVDFANRNRHEFSEFFTKRVRGMHVPHVEFVIDLGEKNRQRLDELSN
jgi:ribosome-binding factor A